MRPVPEGGHDPCTNPTNIVSTLDSSTGPWPRSTDFLAWNPRGINQLPGLKSNNILTTHLNAYIARFRQIVWESSCAKRPPKNTEVIIAASQRDRNTSICITPRNALRAKNVMSDDEPAVMQFHLIPRTRP